MNSAIDFLSQKFVKKFIQENTYTDPRKLILNPPSDFKNQIRIVANQILARQKAKGKLDSWCSNFDLIMPPPLSIEQASSDATCGYKKKLVKGHTLVDLTGGMGIDCLALSESFENTIYVEKEKELCEVFAHNVSILKRDITIVNKYASDFLESTELDYENTTIYLDPARRDDVKNRVFRIEDCTPNLIELLPRLDRANAVVIKFSPLLDIQDILSKISQIKEVHVVSVKNDCKEVLILINKNVKSKPIIHCTNLETSQLDYSFTNEEEHSSQTICGGLESILYEPNTAIMKAGPFDKISSDFKLKKLNRNTHLYTSEKLLDFFPGKVFKVIEHVTKKSISKYAPYHKINVISRNYPMKANDIKKKWKLNDGGNFYLIAFRDKDEKPQTIVANRIDL
ncbi:THUMP-like domain-containing protein [Ekhidna sp.]|uniref:THUMP-like domain-containing protein n=1 Tax=Ekhidna sp. TaxID=2608089 RepID=UPI003B50AF0C